jgi:hypothetical protein
VNTSEPLLGSLRAERRVLGIQTKLHRWANDDPDRRFDDLFNLVTDPAFLLIAWERVAGNKGAPPGIRVLLALIRAGRDDEGHGWSEAAFRGGHRAQAAPRR